MSNANLPGKKTILFHCYMCQIYFYKLLLKSNIISEYDASKSKERISTSSCIHMMGRLHSSGMICMHKHDLFNSGLFTFHLTGVENARRIFSASCQTISLLSKSYYNLTKRWTETMPSFERMRRHPDTLNITQQQIHLITSMGCKSTWNKLVPSLPTHIQFSSHE